MVDSIIKKATGRLKFLYRHSQYFNRKLRKDLCTSLIQCHLDYCSSAWFTGLTKTYQHKLQVLQNKMTRFILDMSPRDHVGQSHLNTLRFLNIQDRAKQIRLSHMFNIYYSTCPSYLSQFFTRSANIHSHATRSNAMNFFVPRVKSHTSKSFFYQATLDWNALPSNIKSIQEKGSFKRAIKAHLARCAVTQELAAFV
jgi:hypothetical protein